MVAGPCGIGKTMFSSQLIFDLPNIRHIELDKIKYQTDQNPSPCSLRYLNLEKCFAPHIQSRKSGFVIDIGGDAIFRSQVDNLARLQQVNDFKLKYDITIILLIASHDFVQDRFLSTKNRHINEFAGVWKAWESIEYPHWLKCADVVIDVENNTLEKLE